MVQIKKNILQAIIMNCMKSLWKKNLKKDRKTVGVSKVTATAHQQLFHFNELKYINIS